LVETLRRIAEERGATVAQVAIALIMAQGEDIIPVVGTRQRQRLEEELSAIELILSMEELKRLEEAIPSEAVAGATTMPMVWQFWIVKNKGRYSIQLFENCLHPDLF
jgi:diketogulonate reductase-like aldo/keto reductase